jgi:response regulator RpfG family c-di-GMP phosphodiesterase
VISISFRPGIRRYDADSKGKGNSTVQVARIPVDTTKLSIGMYVSMLDRPWLETPFIFQGFEIKDRLEIDQLQSYCSQVYVDVDRGTLTEAQVRALAANGVRTTLEIPSKISPVAPRRRFGKVAARLGLAPILARFTRRRSTGYEISTTARAEAPQAKVAYAEAGAAYRAIFDRTRRVGAVDIEMVTEAIMPMMESVIRNPDAMTWTVFSGKRTGQNYSRAAATSVWSMIFGRHLGFERSTLEKLAIGGFLLDIGNVNLTDDLLELQGAMTQEDYEKMPQHVEAGKNILKLSRDVAPEVMDMVACHHERFNGTGYPNRMSGSAIPPFGRIAGIADSYDAMTTRNSYSPALAAYDAARELNDMRNKQFHAEVVGQFLHAIGMFPTGSIVELSDNSVGLVLEQNRSNALQPKLLLIRAPSGKLLNPSRVLNPENWPQGDDARRRCIVRGHEHGAFGIDPADYFNKSA